MAQFSLYVHKGGLKAYSFHLPRLRLFSMMIDCNTLTYFSNQ